MLIANNLSKRYFRKNNHANYFYPVRAASLALYPGEVAVLTGRSGSGKTTLLHMLAGLLMPTEGEVLLDDVNLYALPDAALSRLRAEKISVVPQGRSAVDTLTVLENILLPARLRGMNGDAAAARQWMKALNIANLTDARPAELSGGELRRMAIARALAQNAAILLADEPTGDLDDENTERVLEVFADAAHERGTAVLIVSHDSAALKIADKRFRMDGGALTACDA